MQSQASIKALRQKIAMLMSVGLLVLPMAVSANAPKTVEQVNLTQYAGTWYEIARFPMYFQRHCARDVTATYRLNDNGTINVDNQCVKGNGERIGSIGEATAVDSTNSKLKVTFLPRIVRWLPIGRGDYWVLKLDPQYQTALVGSPNRKYLWILSRRPQLDEQTYLSYVDAARKQGFDITQLQRTIQTTR